MGPALNVFIQWKKLFSIQLQISVSSSLLYLQWNLVSRPVIMFLLKILYQLLFCLHPLTDVRVAFLSISWVNKQESQQQSPEELRGFFSPVLVCFLLLKIDKAENLEFHGTKLVTYSYGVTWVHTVSRYARELKLLRW